MNEKNLSDTQIALLIKNALEYNASIIAMASQIYRQDLKPSYRQRVARQIMKRAKIYGEDINKILDQTNEA